VHADKKQQFEYQQERLEWRRKNQQGGDNDADRDVRPGRSFEGVHFEEVAGSCQGWCEQGRVLCVEPEGAKQGHIKCGKSDREKLVLMRVQPSSQHGDAGFSS
jgi:hypothetical protein